MLEVFRADEFRDFSLFQWMGETPKRMVLDHCMCISSSIIFDVLGADISPPRTCSEPMLSRHVMRLRLPNTSRYTANVEIVFKDDPESGEIFWDKVKSAEKDEVTMPDIDMEEKEVHADEL